MPCLPVFHKIELLLKPFLKDGTQVYVSNDGHGDPIAIYLRLDQNVIKLGAVGDDISNLSYEKSSMRDLEIAMKGTVNDERMVTYRHKNAKIETAQRFRQRAADRLPEWAADVQFED